MNHGMEWAFCSGAHAKPQRPKRSVLPAPQRGRAPMAQVRSRPKKGPLKPVASVADGMLTDSSANVAGTPIAGWFIYKWSRVYNMENHGKSHWNE